MTARFLTVVLGTLALGSVVAFAVCCFQIAATLRPPPLATGLRITAWSAVVLLAYIIVLTRIV